MVLDPRRLPPAKRLWAAELPRAIATVAVLAGSRRRLMAAPKGDGRPVLILPGLFNTDRSNIVMRRYLTALGYRAYRWELGRNLGPRTIGADAEHLFARIEAIRAETRAPVTLIGVSLGGLMARLAAHRLPGAVREVITVSSPFAGNPRATNVWRAYQWITRDSVDRPELIAQQAELAQPLPVPATAIWSRSDGLVNGLNCRAPDDPGCDDIEVRSGHLGVQIKPEVLLAIAGVLGR